MSSYKMNLKDVKFEYFRKGRGPGGQHLNKTATAVRATHGPTCITVEACKERSQSTNKKAAINELQGRLNKIEEDKRKAEQAKSYQAKPESSFSSQLRTYRMCGNVQNVVDHVTGVTHNNVQKVLDGDINIFIEANINKGACT